MSASSVLDEFVKRLEGKLTQLLDQNVGKGKYEIDRRGDGRAFSYKGRTMRNGITINAFIGHDINFPLNFFRVIWTSTSDYKVINGQWERINYPTIFVKVAFNWTVVIEDTYDIPKSLATKILDILERYNPVEGNTNDGTVYYTKTFDVKSPFGEVQTYLTAVRDRKDNIESIHCSYPIDWTNKKWKNYLNNNVVEVSLTDHSSWDAAIDEILNVVLTINADISRYCKDVVSSTLSAFIEDVKERIKSN